MTPEPDLAHGVRLEMERHAIRLKNGIRLLSGRQWAPADPTESSVIWRYGTGSVRRYRSEAARCYREPVLAFTGLVSRPYCFDLAPGNSFVQQLMDAGFDTYVLDWGVPTAEDSGLTLENYLQDLLPRAITAVLNEAGAGELNMLGYCMGGNMALAALAAEPRLPVKNLIVMTTAIDFSMLGPITEALQDGRVPLDSVIDESGNVPASVIETAFKVRRPTSDAVLYANLLQNLWNDEYLVGYQAMSRWVREHVPMVGAAFRQIAEQWVVSNGYLRGSLRLGGKRVLLSSIRVPTLAVIAQRDDMVPQEAAMPIVDVLSGTDVDLLTPDTGHTGLIVGRTAARVTLPQIFDWLVHHSEEMT